MVWRRLCVNIRTFFFGSILPKINPIRYIAKLTIVYKSKNNTTIIVRITSSYPNYSFISSPDGTLVSSGAFVGSFVGAFVGTGAFVAAGVLTGAFVTVGFLVFFGFGACVRFGAFVFLGLADLVGACDLDGFGVFYGLYEVFGVGAEVICGSFGAPVSVSLT